MSFTDIIKGIVAAANTGADVAHLEQELKDLLSNGAPIVANIEADVATVRDLVAQAKQHKIDAGAILAEAQKIQTDVAAVLAVLPEIKALLADLPKIKALLGGK